MAIEIVDFPIKNGGSFHGKMLVHQRVSHIIPPKKNGGAPSSYDRSSSSESVVISPVVLNISWSGSAAATAATEKDATERSLWVKIPSGDVKIAME